MFVADRLYPTRWRLGHVLGPDLPTQLILLGDEPLGPNSPQERLPKRRWISFNPGMNPGMIAEGGYAA
jgi:hypothetical protein